MMRRLLLLLVGLPCCLALAAGSGCPAEYTVVEPNFDAEGTSWTACEDLAHPGGEILLVPASGDVVRLPKSFEPYAPAPDSDYYLGMNKSEVLASKWDMLGQAILHGCSPSERMIGSNFCEPSWAQVERAIPVIRYSRGNRDARGGGPQEWMCSPYGTETGVRTFVGSRSSSVDATFSDHADDCTDNGFPRPQTYVMNLTAIAEGEPAIKDFINYVNFSAMAEGMVGVVQPNVIFYFPILKQNFSGWTGSRYWSMIASPVPDMQGGREQSVWFRFQQIVCEGGGMDRASPSISYPGTLRGSAAGDDHDPTCTLKGAPQYYDTYWYSNSPGNITDRWIRPGARANASGYYGNMLSVKRYWDQTLAAEGMMQLSLPSTSKNNGTWLVNQAVHSIVRSMISREDTWHGRYGVTPGYGISLQDGFEDTFTATATAALEFGSIPYAKGVINNWCLYYLRSNGMATYRAEELAQFGRMLTIFALYQSMTGDSAFLLSHFDKIKALGDLFVYRWEHSLKDTPPDDPRYGIPPGLDEGDGFIAIFAGHPGSHGGYANQLSHMYSNAGGICRGLADAGEMWVKVGGEMQRDDVVSHGKALLEVAPKLRAAIRASMRKTSFPFNATVNGETKSYTCWPDSADVGVPTNQSQCTMGGGRSYPELFYSGLLTREQVDDIYVTQTTSNNSGYVTRPITLGCAGYNSKQVTYWAYGLPYGLLQHDFVERFLLHYFAMSAHTYTRGSWSTPEAASPDRDVGITDYVAAGVVTATTYLKWMLVFEEPESRTVWLAKALPRDWLTPGTQPVIVANATTRYGRLSYRLEATSPANEHGQNYYQVKANVVLPASIAGAPGGLRLRLRAPLPWGRKLASVTVGGKQWPHFNPAAETIDFSAQVLTTTTLSDLESIVATFEQ